MNVPGYLIFRRTVLDLTGIDLDYYKETQMERRLQTIMRRAGAPDLNGYARMLRAAPARVREFLDLFTINVSEWLRNPEKFEELQHQILPSLLRHSRSLKVWSAGCANGSEPYSVAMLLDELTPGDHHQILGTDLDEEVLKVARTGLYHEKDLRAVSPARRDAYFTQIGETYMVKSVLKDRVTFQGQNLHKDPFPSEQDLILCRNVVIYFTEEAKEQLYRRLHRSLRPGGILFVGGTESLLRAREYGYTSVSPFFYQAVK